MNIFVAQSRAVVKCDSTSSARHDSNAVRCWQAGLQGTNRPALYHVLLDENRLSANDLQQLTYKCVPLYSYSRHLIGCCGTARVRLPVQSVGEARLEPPATCLPLL